MFRPATDGDIARIETIYDHIHDAEEAGRASTGWKRHIYPTRQTAVEGVSKGDLYVEEVDGIVVAAGRINQEQLKAYGDCGWRYEASEHEVMVLHTLVVDTRVKGKGYGSAFVDFYETYARARNCHVLRMDTQEKNKAARLFYKRLGFREAGVVLCRFQGIPNVQLVCLEKRV